jgi:hypothetical protein
MYDHLGALKDDALDLAAGAVGVIAGAAVAKWVTSDAALGGALKDKFTGSGQINALIPVAVGVAIQTFGASKLRKDTAARNATTGVAVGMVAFGVGKFVASFMKEADVTNLNKYLPFAGLGETDVYDYGMSGLGIGPGDVTAYMNGAPFTSESLNGAPVDVQLMGAPVSISSEPAMSAMATF